MLMKFKLFQRFPIFKVDENIYVCPMGAAYQNIYAPKPPLPKNIPWLFLFNKYQMLENTLTTPISVIYVFVHWYKYLI